MGEASWRWGDAVMGLGDEGTLKPYPSWIMSLFLLKKKRASGRFLSQGFDIEFEFEFEFEFEISALSTKKHFSRFLRKMRRAQPYASRFHFLGTMLVSCARHCET
ncbi:MAG: hypothetical protein HQM01_15910 [Magnetococcales bacterium]|nr:hypothetical protein [Magnetococcales bacterium]